MRLQVVQFSPDGSLLALGSRDNYIYVYQVNDDATKYSRVGRCMVSIFTNFPLIIIILYYRRVQYFIPRL